LFCDHSEIKKFIAIYIFLQVRGWTLIGVLLFIKKNPLEVCMKTMKKDQEVKRVEENMVNHFLQLGFEFCPKGEWKRKVRDVGKPPKPENKIKD
jgi:hypothetical protein